MKKDIPRDDFAYLIQDISRLLSREFERHAGDLGLSRSQCRVLAYVRQDEGCSQSSLAQLMGIQKIALSRLVDSLEDKGLLQRRSDSDDKRVRRLYLLPESQKVLGHIWSVLGAVSDSATGPLNKQQGSQIIKSLHLVRNHLSSIEN